MGRVSHHLNAESLPGFPYMGNNYGCRLDGTFAMLADLTRCAIKAARRSKESLRSSVSKMRAMWWVPLRTSAAVAN